MENPFGHGISFAGIRKGQVGFDGNYLFILMNIGIFGLIAYLWTYYNLYKASYHLSHEAPKKALRGILIAYMASSLLVYIHGSGSVWIAHLWLGLVIGFFTSENHDHVRSIPSRGPA